MPKKKPSNLFSRGYGVGREKALKGAAYIRTCYNCAYYFQTDGDEKEVCQNPDVLQYDMVVTAGTVFCSRWALSMPKISAKAVMLEKLKKEV